MEKPRPTPPLNELTDVLVVGTGIAALAAAERLHGAGVNVRLVDKARGVGGRMATRRLAEGACDHGVPSFTATDPTFREATHRWIADGAARAWSHDGTDDVVGVPGMTAIAKSIVRRLPTPALDVKLESLSVQDGRWVAAAPGRRFVASAVFLSPPVPQTLELLDAGGVSLASTDDRVLRAVRYSPAFVVLARFAGEAALLPPGYATFGPESPLASVVDDRQKGACAAATATVRSKADWADQHFDDDPATVQATLLAAAAPHFTGPPVEASMHRWRYAVVRDGAPGPWRRLEGLPPAYGIGDAFHRGTVEGAWLSGRLAADHYLAERNLR